MATLLQFRGQVAMQLGAFVSGTVTSRLFQFTSTKPIPPGTVERIYGVTQAEIDSGYIVRVAM